MQYSAIFIHFSIILPRSLAKSYDKISCIIKNVSLLNLSIFSITFGLVCSLFFFKKTALYISLLCTLLIRCFDIEINFSPISFLSQSITSKYPSFSCNFNLCFLLVIFPTVTLFAIACLVFCSGRGLPIASAIFL